MFRLSQNAVAPGIDVAAEERVEIRRMCRIWPGSKCSHIARPNFAFVQDLRFHFEYAAFRRGERNR
jgi:hypothetical protein